MVVGAEFYEINAKLAVTKSKVKIKAELSHNNLMMHCVGVPHLMVVTREEPPYVMIKCGNCSGNERYEGFAIDLLAAISQV